MQYQNGSARLYDNHGRQINYLRLAVTDRCNLRCFYCMPESGIEYVDREDLLSYEEMYRLITLLAAMGIDKVRITGGEPFVRRGMMDFLEQLCQIEGIRQVHITTNGTLTEALVPQLKAIGIHAVNLSLDTLDSDRFFQITRRDNFQAVQQTLQALLQHNMEVKTNTVVMAGRNTEDIIPMARLTQEHPISVRFIEEMPFNGEGRQEEAAFWDFRQILAHLKAHFPQIEKLPDPPHSTAYHYRIPGYKGKIGIIAAYSRTFCGTCNRIRLTPTGMLKTCLYDDGVFNVRDLMRAGASDIQLQEAFLDALSNRAKDGKEAEMRRQINHPISESMSTIGG
ncbi:MAG TPA: GTP 3',8-cyclase MoaA [Saprospiraceae bacterium]|nr:GTP 3',8-cyclase MoaA [Saprospiraceae bacterium]HMQ85242.1 GTP 3',8-cyclase MoaA [Saprospiraceae bacterium]